MQMSWYSFIQKYFGVFFALGLALGFLFPKVFVPITDYVIFILAAVMTFTFITIDFKSVSHNLKNFHQILFSLIVVKVILPFLLFQLAKPLGESVSIAVLLLCLTPFAAVAPTLTRLIGGDVEFIVICQSVSTLLSPIYMPALFMLYAGARIDIDPIQMSKTLIFLVLIPFVLAIIIRPVFKDVIKKTKKYYSAITIILITVLMMGLMTGASAPVMENPVSAIPFTLEATALGIILPLSGWFLFFFFDKPKRLGLSVSSLYMNVGLSAVIAAGFFSPEVMLFVLLYELPANIFPAVIEKISKKYL